MGFPDSPDVAEIAPDLMTAKRQLTTLPIIDVEASGFGGASYPIEIGVALHDGRKFCSLIQPAQEWTHWDEEAEQVHGLSRDLLHAHGKPVQEVAEQLNHLLAGMTLYSDGWVVDKPWLITLFHTAGKAMEFNLSPLEMILSEQQMESWHQTKNRILDASSLQRHRASYDAWVIQETFRQTLNAGPERIVMDITPAV